MATYSYLTDWEAQIDVHARSFAGGDTYFYGSLVAVGNTPAGGGPPNNMSADIMRPNGGNYSAFQVTYYVSGARTEAPKTDLDFYGNPNGIANSTTDATLRLVFNSSTKNLTAYYDPTNAFGAGGGSYNWTPIHSIDTTNWLMTGSDTFTLGISGTSGDNLYSIGGVYFDNFSVTGIAAIPEPSTYAALFGLTALGFATYRRRHRQAA